MKTFCFVAFIVCLDVGHCWLFIPDQKTLSDNNLIKRLLNEQRSGHGKYYPSANSKGHEKRTSEKGVPNIETAISTTAVSSSGLKSDNTVTLTVSSHFKLDLVWNAGVDDRWIVSRGDVRKDGNTKFSGLTLTKEEIDQTYCLIMFVNSPDYKLMLMFDVNKISTPQIDQRVSITGKLFDGPGLPNSIRNGNIYEFSLQTQRNLNTYDFTFFHTYFDPEQVGSEYQVDINYNVELTARNNETNVKAHLGESKPGEQLYVYFKNVNNYGINSVTDMFELSAYRFINIPRDQPASSSELLFFNQEKDNQRFPSTINYGSLECTVTGKPVPTLEVSKDGKVLDAECFTLMNMTAYVLIPFDGKALDEVSGTYKCKASNGNFEAVQEIHVVGNDKW